MFKIVAMTNFHHATYMIKSYEYKALSHQC